MKKIKKLSDKQQEKYSRQILMNQIGGKGQLSIINSSVLVIGCGGLGTSAISYLAMAGIGKIGIVDFDKVSLSNLNRQSLFTEKDIGRLKVDVVEEKVKLINSDINLIKKNTRITASNLPNLLKNFKIVLDCTDNFKSRYIINNFCHKYRKILISAALFNFEVQLFTFKSWERKAKFPCYNCIFPNIKQMNGMGNCSELGIIANVAGLGGILQASMVLNLILKPKNYFYKEFLIYDCSTTTQKKIFIKKNTNCIVCNK